MLRRRVRTVIARYSSGDLVPFIESLKELGEVFAFGGVLRDQALKTPAAFTSDVDLVVSTVREADFDALLAGRGVENRFGGYRIRLKKGSVDVWPFSRTWAFRVGAIEGRRPEDLIKTTFFSWDAIAYSLSTGQIHCAETYLEGISAGVVDLQFVDNPYPLGALVRTSRLLVTGKAAITTRLARHTVRLLDRYSDDHVLTAEARGFAVPVLTKEALRLVRSAVTGSLFQGSQLPVRLSRPATQLELPLGQALASETLGGVAGTFTGETP
ncbi:MAG TPA: hypothetical protein VK447_12190 [Myxococcaceae bacterium]|nr:hypothetical protein [Myxococcaceae bacterium]